MRTKRWAPEVLADGRPWLRAYERILQPDFKAREWLRSYPMSDPAQIARLERALGQLGF